jgi:hypothetical protein
VSSREKIHRMRAGRQRKPMVGVCLVHSNMIKSDQTALPGCPVAAWMPALVTTARPQHQAIAAGRFRGATRLSRSPDGHARPSRELDRRDPAAGGVLLNHWASAQPHNSDHSSPCLGHLYSPSHVWEFHCKSGILIPKVI